ncbi:MAG TPA: hypothetical protein VFE62_11250 [Gemmataceae bacterium]|nr:hypothetical protein [Gemmataceae bacterium]
MRTMVAILALGVATAGVSRAGGPKQKQSDFVPPAPKQIDPAFPPLPMVKPGPVIVIRYQRTDTRDVWQHYAPSRLGRMVPRVVSTPYGDFYSRSGEPYPFAGVSKTAILPIIVD